MPRSLCAILAVSLAFATGPALADVDVKYVAHACFVVVSPDGVRVVIDPYNSNRWLGYSFPDSVAADAVLITHPHYDHDASYYFGDSVPVFREPGRYRVGDVELLGVEGRHADPYGEDFGQENTIWVVEAGGVRIAHLGDNGPLSDATAGHLGRVDVLMVPADGDDHILKSNEIASIRKQLGQPLVIPMHYRLDGFLGLPRSLGPIDPWLEGQEGVARLDSNRARLASKRDPARRVLVFQPSPDLEQWSPELVEGWGRLDDARDIVKNEPERAPKAALLVQQAAESVPSIVFAFQWARVLAQSSRTAEAIAVLEQALARAARDDWEYRMRARSLLAELYAGEGSLEAAAAQHRIVLDQSRRLELIEKARGYLEGTH